MAEAERTFRRRRSLLQRPAHAIGATGGFPSAGRLAVPQATRVEFGGACQPMGAGGGGTFGQIFKPNWTFSQGVRKDPSRLSAITSMPTTEERYEHHQDQGPDRARTAGD